MQVALAWLLQRAPNILLIPGTSSRTHLRKILPPELVLPAEALRTLDNIATAARLTCQTKWREPYPSSIFAWKNLTATGTIDPTNGA
jgi:diketogulonate reductase-like aldo/keto reductase